MSELDQMVNESENDPAVLPEHFHSWKSNPITQEFLKLLAGWAGALTHQWKAGDLEVDNPHLMLVYNVATRAKVELLEQILEMDYEAFLAGVRNEYYPE
jgi:hypothetical protein